jgi:hypothetical protein
VYFTFIVSLVLLESAYGSKGKYVPSANALNGVQVRFDGILAFKKSAPDVPRKIFPRVLHRTLGSLVQDELDPNRKLARNVPRPPGLRMTYRWPAASSRRKLRLCPVRRFQQ